MNIFGTQLRKRVFNLYGDVSGFALTEFAFAAPILLVITMSGAELANFSLVKMRVDQLAVTVADNMSRIGEGSVLAAKRINEAQINDILEGAMLQANNVDLMRGAADTQEEPGSLHIYGTGNDPANPSAGNGRIIVSNLEPVAIPNTAKQYKITWQRCRGLNTAASSYGASGATNLTGIGPAGQQATAPDNSATIFVEIKYQYKPIFFNDFSRVPTTFMTSTAAMVVRDRRDLSQIYPVTGETVRTC
jgi:hypothetical protein